MDPERNHLDFLEPFKHPDLPFLYAVDDSSLYPEVFSLFPKRTYGLETGFGSILSNVFNIDINIPWVVTEIDTKRYVNFKRWMCDAWRKVDFNNIQITQPIIAVNTSAPSEFQKNAHTLLYRNLNYNDMYMISHNQLQTGQRVVFVVDGQHADGDETQLYRQYLREYGYNPNLLQLRSKSLPRLSELTDYIPDQLVLDITK